MDDVATKHQRAPGSVNLFSLYYKLWRVATEKSNGQGFENGRECPFTREEIEHALCGQGIRNEDIQAAIDHCIREICLRKGRMLFTPPSRDLPTTIAYLGVSSANVLHRPQMSIFIDAAWGHLFYIEQ